MSYSIVNIIILVLLSKAAARTVLFNYNTDMDTATNNINTAMEDIEGLDDGMRMFLEGVKQNFGVRREENPVKNINFESDSFRRFFNPSIVEDEESPDEVEILKIWKLADFQ